MSKLRVGAAKVCINPTPDMMPFPGGFIGLGSGLTHMEGIYSDCYARAVVIDNGETQMAFLGFDLGGPPAGEAVKPMIEVETGIPARQIMLSATHNHTGCGIFASNAPEDLKKGEDYQKLVQAAAVEVVKQAKAALRPAKYGYGEGKSYINMNRDCPDEFGGYVQAPNPEGFCDKTVSVLKFVDENDQLIAAIANYGMHATLGFLQPDVDGKMKISGNLPGAASEYVEKRYGNGAVMLWTSAAAGDQGPAIGGVRDYEEDGFARMAEMLPGVHYRFNTIFGKQHGVDICKTLAAIGEYSEQMPIRFVETKIGLPAQKVPGGADMVTNRQYVERVMRIPEGADFVQMEDDPSREVPLYVQQAVLGDVALVGVAAEIYGLIGKACKEASPYKKTMVVTHVDRSIGYILDRTSKDHKVFQSFGAVKPGVCDELIVDCVKQQFDELLK